MAVKSCLTWFRVIPGIGVQPISGIVDADGDQFVPEIVHTLSGSNVFGSLYYNGTGVYNTTAVDISLQRMSDGAAAYTGGAELPQFSAKICSGGGGTGATGGFASLEANAFFGGDVYRYGKFQNAALGSIELNLTKNDNYFATDVLCLCLAGVETEQLPFGLTNGAKTSSLANVAALYVPPFEIGTPNTIGASAGFPQWGVGWATRSGSQHCSTIIGAQSINARAQSGAAAYHQAQYTSAPYATGFPVPTWTGANSWTVAGRTTGGSGTLVLGGTNVRAASGVIQQPPVPGNQRIVTGIKGRWIALAGMGTTAPTAGTGLTDLAEFCLGWSDCRNQGQFWFGETRVGNTLPLLGASYSSHSALLRFAGAGANSGSTAFTSIATFVEADPTGSFTINWSSVDGIARDINWFVLGEDADTPPPPIPTSNPMCLVPLPAPVLTR